MFPVNNCRYTRGQLFLSLLHNLSEYQLDTQWEGSCGYFQVKTTKPVRWPPGHAYRREQTDLPSYHACTHTRHAQSWPDPCAVTNRISLRRHASNHYMALTQLILQQRSPG